jgi:hypothetical protein
MNIACNVIDGRSESEKQSDFESNFEPGMSRSEVEQKLNEMGITEFIKESKFDNGDVAVSYRTSYKNEGAPSYIFRFTADGELIIMYPLSFGG